MRHRGVAWGIGIVLIIGLGVIGCAKAAPPAVPADTQSAAAAPVSDYTFVKLAYNYDMVSDKSNYADGSGWDIPGDELPAFGGEIVSPLSGVPFKMEGASNAKNCLEPSGGRIEIDQSNVRRIHFLGLSCNNGTPSNVTIVYADGDRQSVSLFFPDWWDPDKYSGGGDYELVMRFQCHNEKDGAKEPPVGLWRTTIATKPEKTISALELAENKTLRIFAITLDARVQAPAAIPVSAQAEYVPFALSYNQDMISPMSDLASGTGWDFPMEDFPAFGTTFKAPKSGVPFTMTGATATANCFELHGGEVAVGQRGVKYIHFLGMSHSNGTPADITVLYADGTSITKPLALPDWWDPEHYTGGGDYELVLKFPKHHEKEGAKDPGVGLWRTTIATNPDLELKAIKFPDNDKIRIFAITLEK